MRLLNADCPLTVDPPWLSVLTMHRPPFMTVVRISRRGIVGRGMRPGQPSRRVLPGKQVPELGGQQHGGRLPVHEHLRAVLELRRMDVRPPRRR